MWHGAGAKHLSLTVTRSKFEQMTDALLTRTRQPCKDCLRDAGVTQKDITEVLLVGGMTRMPKARTPPGRAACAQAQPKLARLSSCRFPVCLPANHSCCSPLASHHLRLSCLHHCQLALERVGCWMGGLLSAIILPCRSSDLCETLSFEASCTRHHGGEAGGRMPGGHRSASSSSCHQCRCIAGCTAGCDRGRSRGCRWGRW